ncbi:MAG TPA: 4-carboxymuconolactone decarboxylase [bacterium]|nr:4-carboxymuconolactone decarboxylase [bacterium]
MSREQFEKGLEMRRKVLGEEHVNASLESADDFTQPLQEMVTENAWGTVWSREGLPLKTRSMLTLAMLTALNRPHELKIHLRGAVRNGVTKDEVREILLHTHAYCGWPATIDAFRVAREFFAETEAKH